MWVINKPLFRARTRNDFRKKHNQSRIETVGGKAHREPVQSDRVSLLFSPISMSRTNQWRGCVSLHGELGWLLVLFAP